MATKPPPAAQLLSPESSRILKHGDLEQAVKMVRDATGLSADEARSIVQEFRSANPLKAIKATMRLVAAGAAHAHQGGKPAPAATAAPHAKPSGAVKGSQPHGPVHAPNPLLNRPKGLSPGEVPRGDDGSAKWFILTVVGTLAVVLALNWR